MLSEAKKTSTKAENIQQNLFLYRNDELGFLLLSETNVNTFDHWLVTTRSKSAWIVLLTKSEALHRDKEPAAK